MGFLSIAKLSRHGPRELKCLFEGRVALGPVGQPPTSHLFLNERSARVTENTLRRRLWELMELMGHSDLYQVMKYALSAEKRARAGVARL